MGDQGHVCTCGGSYESCSGDHDHNHGDEGVVVPPLAFTGEQFDALLEAIAPLGDPEVGQIMGQLMTVTTALQDPGVAADVHEKLQQQRGELETLLSVKLAFAKSNPGFLRMLLQELEETQLEATVHFGNMVNVPGFAETYPATSAILGFLILCRGAMIVALKAKIKELTEG
jgi:hypothetical protein